MQITNAVPSRIRQPELETVGTLDASALVDDLIHPRQEKDKCSPSAPIHHRLVTVIREPAVGPLDF